MQTIGGYKNRSTPVNQKVFTNVAYVRLSLKGKKFEIACYRNRALAWKNKIEDDLDETVQTDEVATSLHLYPSSMQPTEHLFPLVYFPESRRSPCSISSSPLPFSLSASLFSTSILFILYPSSLSLFGLYQPTSSLFFPSTSYRFPSIAVRLQQERSAIRERREISGERSEISVRTQRNIAAARTQLIPVRTQRILNAT
jgi:hypothetical protein